MRACTLVVAVPWCADHATPQAGKHACAGALEDKHTPSVGSTWARNLVVGIVHMFCYPHAASVASAVLLPTPPSTSATSGRDGSAIYPPHVYLGGSGPIAISQLACKGTEANLTACPMRWMDNRCKHSQDIALHCSRES